MALAEAIGALANPRLDASDGHETSGLALGHAALVGGRSGPQAVASQGRGAP